MPRNAADRVAGAETSTPPPWLTLHGPTTVRAGSPSCWTAPRRCSRSSPERCPWTSAWPGCIRPGSPEALEVRAPFSGAGQHGRGPGHGQPERLAGASGCSAPAASRPPTWPVRARPWAAAAGCASPRTATARSGWAAASSPASAARWRSSTGSGCPAPARPPAAPHRLGCPAPAAWPVLTGRLARLTRYAGTLNRCDGPSNRLARAGSGYRHRSLPTLSPHLTVL